MFDIVTLVQAAGYVGLTAIVFAESGLFFGFFLPGDSLLFTAGFLASQGLLDMAPLVFLLFVAAVAGDTVGYWFGKKIGRSIFSRPQSRFFNPAHIVRTQHFFERYGKKAIVLARFVPIVRTFTPIMAGVGTMPYPTFAAYNIAGGFLWVVGMTLGGYFLGQVVPHADRYVEVIVIGIIVVSLIPIVREYLQMRRGYR